MLHNWLRPIALDQLQTSDLTAHEFGAHLQLHSHTLPNLEQTRIALLGTREADTDAVRQALYRLRFPFQQLQIADLGNTHKPDNAFIIPLLKELLDSQIVPILISPNAATVPALYKAFQSLQSHVNFNVVDERLWLNEAKKGDNAFYLNDILLNSRSRLFHFGAIGCQTHYTDPAALQFLEKNNFDCIRLGVARAEVSEIEPVVRDGDLLAFHLSALKQAEAPGVANASPSGFTVEEACQISRYAGMSDKLKAFGIFGFQTGLDRDQQTAQAVSQLIWYFVEGFYNRKQDFPASNDGLIEYIVEFKSMDYQLTFWKSQRSGRWWMQVPVKIGKKYHRHKLIPCSYNDYKLACQDELPERLLNAYKRFL
jgi:formiminoglutamase